MIIMGQNIKSFIKITFKLTAHNIGFIKRIDKLKEGDEVEFYGEYRVE